MGKIQPALCVGNDARTMKRWAAALSSDDLEFALRAFGGRGADGKVKPPLARYVQRRYRQLAGTVRCYRRLIAAEVEDLFAERLSGETLRRLFREADREDAEPEAGSLFEVQREDICSALRQSLATRPLPQPARR